MASEQSPLAEIRAQHCGAPWTDERVELLKKLRDERKSASEIAAELGGGITRNAVVSKVHRLGLRLLSEKQPGTGHRPKRQAPASTSDVATIAVPYPTCNSGVASVEMVSVKRVEVPTGQRSLLNSPSLFLGEVVVPASARARHVSLLSLDRWMCRWPVPGGLDCQHFCGAPREQDRPYCPQHTDRAYRSVVVTRGGGERQVPLRRRAARAQA